MAGTLYSHTAYPSDVSVVVLGCPLTNKHISTDLMCLCKDRFSEIQRELQQAVYMCKHYLLVTRGQLGAAGGRLYLAERQVYIYKSLPGYDVALKFTFPGSVPLIKPDGLSGRVVQAFRFKTTRPFRL